KFTAAVRKRLHQLHTKKPDTKLATLERQLHEVERRVRNVTEAIANGGWNAALDTKLKAEEARLAALKAQVAAMSQQEAPVTLPTDEVIRQQLWSLMKLVSADPVRGREALIRCLKPFVLTPTEEVEGKHYKATGALNVFVVMETP